MSWSSLSHTDPIGTSIGVLGIILAFALYFRAKTDVRLCYAVVTPHYLIFPSDKPNPSTTSNGLSTVIILVWNRGRSILSRDDIASSDPLTLKFSRKKEEVEVLEVRSTHATREAINARATVSGSLIHLDFEFLGRLDGFAFEVFFAGDPNVRIEYVGTVKGSQKRRRRYEPLVSSSSDFASPFLLIREGATVLGFALASCISLGFLVEHLSKLPANVIGSLWSALFFVFFASMLIFGIYEFRQEKIPRKLRKLIGKFWISYTIP